MISLCWHGFLSYSSPTLCLSCYNEMSESGCLKQQICVSQFAGTFCWWLISASWVARITGVSHRHLATHFWGCMYAHVCVWGRYLALCRFFFCGTGVLNSGLCTCKAGALMLEPQPFYSGYFEDGVSWTICPGWTQTWILLISTSHVVRITGVSHQLPASVWFIYLFLVLPLCIFRFPWDIIFLLPQAFLWYFW
jgi:hypothetical protein